LIVVDTSALIAILLNEAEKLSFVDILLTADVAHIGAPNYFEVSMVAEAQQGKAGCHELDRLASAFELVVAPFGADHIETARDAFRRYGKGRHRAGLNFGDCCAYALARTLDAPLLFKGNDFALTDIKRVP